MTLYVSGRVIRHTFKKQIDVVTRTTVINNLKNKAAVLSREKKVELKLLIAYLTVGLRSRNSGLVDDKDKRYFNNRGDMCKFRIDKDAVGVYLKEIFGGDESIGELETEVFLCMPTHDHTSFKSVTKYTDTAIDFILAIGLDVNTLILKTIRDVLESKPIYSVGSDIATPLLRCSGADLRAKDLTKFTNLSGVDLRNYSLTGSWFSGGRLTLSKISLTNLKDILASNVHSLIRVDLANLDLRGIDFAHINLEKANLSGADLRGARFAHSNLELVKLNGAKLDKDNIFTAWESGANLREVDLSNLDLSHMNFSTLWVKAHMFSRKAEELVGVNFSGSKLNGASFYEFNLTDANFSNADLRGAFLGKVVLTGANFEGAKLDAASLSNVLSAGVRDLSGINLVKQDLRSSLSYIKLTNANLESVDAHLCTLEYADLTGAILVNANLYRANLAGAILVGANLRGAKLEGANLKGADLRDADLEGTDLRNAKLAGAKLNRKSLLGACDVNANLRGVDISDELNDIDLSHIDLTNVNLSGAIMRSINLSGSRLIRTKLSGAELSWDCLLGVDLSRLNLANGGFSLNIANVSCIVNNITPNFELIKYFNHIRNESKTSVLTSIDSISSEYSELKVQLMNQIITLFNNNNIDVSNIVEALKDILYNNKIYLKDKNINKFIVEQCMDNTIKSANTEAITLTNLEINTIWDYVGSLEGFNQVNFMLVNNSFINQVIYGCKNHETEITRNIGDKLQRLYFEQIEVTNIFQTDGINDFLDDGFLFLKVDENQELQALILSKNYLDKFLYNKPVQEELNWDNIIWVKTNLIQAVGVQNLGGLFQTFTLFNKLYQEAQRKSGFKKLLNLLNLGQYKEHFLSALEVKNYEGKLTDPESQRDLNRIFGGILTPDDAVFLVEEHALNISISDEHFAQIIELYGLGSESNEVKALYLLCLAGVFTNYSSSSFFGIEYDSPTSLRYYAFALLNKAIELHPTLVTGLVNSAPFGFPPRLIPRLLDWKNRFLGINGGFTCTYILFGLITGYVKSISPEIYETIKPTGW